MKLNYLSALTSAFTLMSLIVLQPAGREVWAQELSLDLGSNYCGNLGSPRSRSVDCVVLGRQLQAAGQVDRAIVAYSQAIEQDASFAIAPYSRGIAYLAQENWQAAILDFQTAIRLSPQLSDAYRGLRTALRETGRSQELGVTDRPADFAQAEPYRIQGDEQWQQRRWDEAIAAYQQVSQLHANWPDTFNRLGIAYYELGRSSRSLETLEASLEAYGTAIALCNRPNVTMRGMVTICADNTNIYYQNMVTLYRELEGWYRQQNRIEEAQIAAAKQFEVNPDLVAFRVLAQPTVKDYNALGRALYARARYPEAIAAYNQAIQRIATADSQLAASVYNNLGTALSLVDDEAGAIDAYRQATTLNPAPAQYVNLTRALIRTEQWNELIAVYREFEQELAKIETIPVGTSVIDSLNIVAPPSLKDYTDRARNFAEKQDYYAFYIQQLMNPALPADLMLEPGISPQERALEISERARSRALLESLILSEAFQITDPQLKQQKEALEKQGKQLTERFNRLNAAQNRDPADLNVRPVADSENVRLQIAQEIQTLRQQYKAVIDQIRVQNPRYGELDPLTPTTVPEIQGLLDDDTLLLEYWLGDQNSYLWIISEDGIKWYELPERKQIERAATDFYNYLISPGSNASDSGLQDGFKLTQMILGPAIADRSLRNKRLLIAADGKLQSIPFSALPIPNADEINNDQIDWRDPPPPLLRSNEIVHIPSASTLSLMRARVRDRNLAPQPLALVVDPALSGAKREVEVIRSEAVDEGIGDQDLVHVRELTATETNVSDITSSLNQYRLIHFAMHGQVNEDDPAKSGLLLFLNGQSGEEHYFLRLTDVFNLPVLSADLVVLSSCQTGLGSEVQGEGLVGLTKGFMYAGAERVLVSLWNVNDEATAALMTRFYNELIDHHNSPAEALRKAQLDMLNSDEWQNPFYWAGFTLQGEWQNLRQRL